MESSLGKYFETNAWSAAFMFMNFQRYKCEGYDSEYRKSFKLGLLEDNDFMKIYLGREILRIIKPKFFKEYRR